MHATRIGRYEIVEHLATGGMGKVYLARAAGLGGFVRHVVVKALDLPGTAEDEAIGMFLDEARLLGLLHHQHIAPVYEVGRDKHGRFFLVMDFIHGQTAHDVWQATHQLGAALPIDFSLTVAAAAASGLHYAHTRRDTDGHALRLVHRDVTLSNLMIGFDGGVKLIDFGIAKATNRSTHTQVGIVKGKLGYMAPEQLRGHAVDARTDVFALGIVLYELTTMARAFRDESDRVTIDRIFAGEFVPPSVFDESYPPALEQIVVRALRVDPRERYPDTESMRREIDLVGHQLGLVLGDAAVVEVMNQLFAQRDEPWQRGRRREHAATDLSAVVAIEAPDSREDPTQPTPARRPPGRARRLRAATEVAELQLPTPPHGVPKRPSIFSVGAKPGPIAAAPVDRSADAPPRKRRIGAIGWAAMLLIAMLAVAGTLYLVYDPAPAPEAVIAAPTVVPLPAPKLGDLGAASPVAPAVIRVRIATTPADAVLFLDGKRLGRTPYAGTVTSAPGEHTLEVRKPGFATVNLPIVLDGDVERTIELSPAK